MAFLSKISNRRKRPFDEGEDDDCELDELRNPRKSVTSKYPPPKKRFGLQIVRDYPPGCGIKQDPIRNQPPKSHFKKSDIPNKDKLVISRLKTVKFWDPNCNSKKPKDTNPTAVSVSISQKDKVRREKIQEAMTMFDKVYTQLFYWRVPAEAAKMVKQKLKWVEPAKTVGPICGVEIGDKFKFRSQLQMIGLHCQPQSGIDYTKINGKNLAVSIVDSHRYYNERGYSDVLFYSGQGGVKFMGNKHSLPEDQKLERGNLALKNSMNEKSPVRVVRKLHGGSKRHNGAFVYDGLYIVTDCKEEKGAEGKMVFMFKLNRVSGQAQLHTMLNAKR